MTIPGQEEETRGTEETMETEVEETTETEETEETQETGEEEFDEITYNKETVKIPKSERQTYLQKGYNYDKVHGKLTEQEKKLARLREFTGMDLDAALENLEQQAQQQRVEQYAVDHGITEEDARRDLDKDRRLQELESEVKITKRLQTLNQEKAAIKDKIYFSELEPEIDQLVTDNARKGVDISVEAAYHYLRGQRLEELMGQTKDKAVKKTLADVQDRMNRGLTTGSESQEADQTANVDTEMTSAFGTDPKRIAAYVKQELKQLKRR